MSELELEEGSGRPESESWIDIAAVATDKGKDTSRGVSIHLVM